MEIPNKEIFPLMQVVNCCGQMYF